MSQQAQLYQSAHAVNVIDYLPSVINNSGNVIFFEVVILF
jgi:hypothetical protein